jgi:putative nucleotidyltransferase with HDIG domain
MKIADQYIDGVKDLPPAPTVAIELLELFKEPNEQVDHFVELIQHDPSLTAKIMQKCNGAYFSGSEPVSDMFEVVMRLGFYEVYCVVAGVVGASAVALGKAQKSLDVNSLWHHSVLTAVAASKLAKRLQEPEATAFTAGLLHDIGKLVFASVATARYPEIMKQSEGCGGLLGQAELAAFGTTHAKVGARLLLRCGLPENIVIAVLHHHGSPDDAGAAERLVAIIQLANIVAYKVAKERSRACDLAACNPNAMKVLGLKDTDLPDIIAQTEIGLERVSGILQQQF